VWSIGQTQQPGIPWLGWNTQHPSVLSGISGPVTLTLSSVDGPGDLAVYMSGVFGGIGERVFDTVGGPRSTSVPLNTHAHGNWTFTAPGVYAVTITESATTTAGQKVSASATLRFFVGSGDPRTAAPTTTVTDWVGRTASGADCDLSAEQRAKLPKSSGSTGGGSAVVVPAVAVEESADQAGLPDAAAGDTVGGAAPRPSRDAGESTASVQEAASTGSLAATWVLAGLAAAALVGAGAAGVAWRRTARAAASGGVR